MVKITQYNVTETVKSIILSKKSEQEKSTRANSALSNLPRLGNTNYKINIDYFIESATYGFLFTSCKTLENERVNAANE